MGTVDLFIFKDYLLPEEAVILKEYFDAGRDVKIGLPGGSQYWEFLLTDEKVYYSICKSAMGWLHTYVDPGHIWVDDRMFHIGGFEIEIRK